MDYQHFPKSNHPTYYSPSKVFAFLSVLPGMDIYTDVKTGESFITHGHFYWGFCTMLFVFLPFLERLAIIQCFVKEVDINIENLPNKTIRFKVLWSVFSELFWHLQHVSIVRSAFTNAIRRFLTNLN
jgi:hypothetical protein